MIGGEVGVVELVLAVGCAKYGREKVSECQSITVTLRHDT